MSAKPKDRAPRTLMERIRLRVMAVLLGTSLAAIAMISLTSLPAWPVVGVAVATVAMMVNKVTSRLRSPVCWGCGGSIEGQASGEYGVTCPDCGTLTPKSDARRA
jgi:tRNA(Ile2) C34 agmatinyltransferase TiaS